MIGVVVVHALLNSKLSSIVAQVLHDPGPQEGTGKPGRTALCHRDEDVLRVSQHTGDHQEKRGAGCVSRRDV